MRLAWISALVLAALCAPLAAQPSLVEDINTVPLLNGAGSILMSYPGGAASDRGIFYFVASDPAHGRELWRTDGTEAGTWRVADVCPGPCDSSPSDLAVFHGRLYFNADDGVSGRELWQVDGTAGSERQVRDLCPGPCHGDPRELKELGGELLFTASNGRDRQLWQTTGSRQSTAAVATLCAEPDYGSCAFGLVRAGNRVLFIVQTPTSLDLWRSDGTPGGTGPLRDLVPGLPQILWEGVLPAEGFAFVWTVDSLWRTDGTAAGTMRLRDLSELVTGPESLRFNFPSSVIWQGMLLSFREMDAMVRSDGTPEGTVRVPGLPRFLDVRRLVALPDGLLFTGDEPTSLDSLWSTRGTLETTRKLLDPGDGPDFSSYIYDVVPLGDRALFRVGRETDQPFELWVTDGTPEGTRQLDRIAAGFYGSDMVSDGTRAFFPAGSTSFDLWRTDGTEAGTRRLRNFGAAPGSSGPIAQTVLGDALLFSARTVDLEAPLFRTDGTSTGTRVLSDEASWSQGFTRVGDRVFFGAAMLGYTGPAEYYLPTRSVWWTDGTAAGTQEVSKGLVAYQPLGVLAGQLLFGGADSIPPYYGGPEVEPWRSDGRGASRVKDIYTWDVETGFHHICVPGGSTPGPGVLVGQDRLVFAAEDGRSGRELWVTNGNRTGTRLLADINPVRLPEPPESDCDNRRTTGASSDPQSFVRLRDGAVFIADDGTTGKELWWTDGTPVGTRPIKDLRPGAESSEPHDLTPFQGEVWFVASADGVGEALWRTDGTSGGIVLVHPLKPGGLPSWARSLTVVGQKRLFFTVYNEATGAELWTSHGTAASTRLVVDLRRGPLGSYPQNLANAGGVLVFAATDGTTGLEPWRSDGTAAGTVRLGDINPGREASSPGPFSRVGDVVLTGAYDAGHGRELWAIPMEDVLEP